MVINQSSVLYLDFNHDDVIVEMAKRRFKL